jgi:hypothetical protein
MDYYNNYYLIIERGFPELDYLMSKHSYTWYFICNAKLLITYNEINLQAYIAKMCKCEEYE